MAEALTLDEQAQAAFDRALESGTEQDRLVAARAIYAAADEIVEARESYQDVVVLCFLIELAGKVRKLEEQAGLRLEPPTRG